MPRGMEAQTITAFLAVGAIIFVGFLANIIFTKYRVPDVLLLILLGVLLGPELIGGSLGFFTYDSLAEVNKFRDIFLNAALVLILFDGGLNLDLRSALKSMKLATFITVLTFVCEMLLVALALFVFLGLDIKLALVVGTIVGGTSEAVVIPIARKMRIREETKAMLVMESVITDVLVIVIAIAMMSAITLGDVGMFFIPGELAIDFLVGAAIGFVAGTLWLFVLQRLQNQPMSYMITVAALFFVAGVAEMPPIESSSVVAALMFGLAIGNRKLLKRRMTSITLRLSSDEHIQEFQEEISFFVRTFFYVYLGVVFIFGSFELMHLVVGLGIIGIIMATRRGTSLLAWKIGDLDRGDANALFAMMPRGLAAAVLATMPATLLSGQPFWEDSYADLILNIVLIVIVGTTIVASILVIWTERKIDRVNHDKFSAKIYEE